MFQHVGGGAPPHEAPDPTTKDITYNKIRKSRGSIFQRVLFTSTVLFRVLTFRVIFFTILFD
jgi:hypothetical protein